jgi:enterochelin esterase-like enzyme
MHQRLRLFTLTLAPAIVFAAVVSAQVSTPPHGTVAVISVHGASLEGNLEGDSPDRQVSIYLPPSYQRDGARRYPVVYLLHGYTDTDDRWFGRVRHFIDVPAVADRAVAARAREMIIVMPNAYTRYQGSMYSSSLTTGDWENFIARELVTYIDSHYRTIANRMSRGLAGHSMGGYGTLRIGMKHPDVFSSVYALSACCLMLNERLFAASGDSSPAEAIGSFEEFEKADFGTKAQFASAAAWSANPARPPFFLDLPTRNGQLQPLVVAKWAANAPLAMAEQYLSNLKQLKSIAFDAGDKDTAIAATSRMLDAMFTSYKLPHVFEIYDGNHVNHIADRVEKHVLPFFSKNLAATPDAPGTGTRPVRR